MGHQLNEENPHHVYQPYRLPGQRMMRSRGCTITATGTMIRCREVYYPGSDWAGGGVESL